MACTEKVAHERGRPQHCKETKAGAGVGYAHSSEDKRKGKTARSEGALL